MNEIDGLLKNYERFVRLPWEANLAGPQKVWFVQYDPSQERRLRPRLGDFEVATRAAGHGWVSVDLSDAFPEWMARHEYREEYFADPEAMGLALADFSDEVTQRVIDVLTARDADDKTVVAVVGLGSLYPVTRSSELVERAEGFIRGRLLAFFPGTRIGPSYRLLDSRDGWNYHAILITARSDES